MSQTTETVLDPKRPWLTDARELPGHMNWFETLFDPTGESPRLHFTRAGRFCSACSRSSSSPFTIALVLSLAGGDGEGVSLFGTYATPIVFVVTTLLSYVIHSRRLNDAGKSPLWAILPLLPLLLGAAFFANTAMSKAAEYDKKFEMRQDYLTDPEAFRERQREEREKAEAAAAKKGEQAQQRRGGPPSSLAADLKQPLPPRQAMSSGGRPDDPVCHDPAQALIAIWSLMWVARSLFWSLSG